MDPQIVSQLQQQFGDQQEEATIWLVLYTHVSDVEEIADLAEDAASVAAAARQLQQRGWEFSFSGYDAGYTDFKATKQTSFSEAYADWQAIGANRVMDFADEYGVCE